MYINNESTCIICKRYYFQIIRMQLKSNQLTLSTPQSNSTRKAYLCSNEISDKRVYVSLGNLVNMTLANPTGLRYTVSFKGQFLKI